MTIHTTEPVHPSGREHWRKMVVERYFLDVNIDVAAAQCVSLACSLSRQLLSLQGSSGFEVLQTMHHILR